MPEPQIRWQLHATPNPSEFSLSVSVSQAQLQLNPLRTPIAGALFRDFYWIPDMAMKADDQFGLYLYTYSETGADGWMQFYFSKDKTAEEANTPFRAYREFKNHHWPKILQALGIVQDYTYPNVTNTISGSNAGIVTAPMNYGKYALVDDVDEGSIFVTEEFFGSLPFNIPRYPVPVTSPVHVEVLGVRYDFPNALHPKIVIPNTRTGDASLVAGSASGVGGALNGQVFPATNFETWAPYVLTDQQEQRSGGWYRIRVRVFPPDIPDTSVGNT